MKEYLPDHLCFCPGTERHLLFQNLHQRGDFHLLFLSTGNKDIKCNYLLSETIAKARYVLRMMKCDIVMSAFCSQRSSA